MKILIDGSKLAVLERMETCREPRDTVQDFIALFFETLDEEAILPLLSEKALWFRNSQIYGESCEKEFFENIRRQAQVSCCRRISFLDEKTLEGGLLAENGAITPGDEPVAMVQGEYFCQTDENTMGEITSFNFVCVLREDGWKVNFFSSRNTEMSERMEEVPFDSGTDLTMSELCLQIPLAAFTCRDEVKGFELVNMNELALELLGYPDTEYLKRSCGFSVLNLIHPDDLGGFVGSLRATGEQLRGMKPMAIRFRHADYTYHWMLVKLARGQERDGSEICLCMCMTQSFGYYSGRTGQILDHRDIQDLMVESMDPPGDRARVRTFGYFDIFHNGNAVAFRHKKAKELLALLVDLRGGFLSPSEAISMLWEDEPVDRNTLSRYRKTAMYLRETLQEAGLEDILHETRGLRRIVPEKLDCDCYNYLKNPRDRRQFFSGSYMLNYSWAENTAAMLNRLAEEESQRK